MLRESVEQEKTTQNVYGDGVKCYAIHKRNILHKFTFVSLIYNCRNCAI